MIYRVPDLKKGGAIPRLRDAKTSENVCGLIEVMLRDDKAEDVTVLDLIGKTSIADHMIIASGRSARHVTAIADHIIDRLKEVGADNVSVEGRQQADWILLDVGDVIIHLFRPEIRAFYNLEKMWAVPLPENISR